MKGSTDQCNVECAWDEFDSESYFRHNYANLRVEDGRILEIVRDFLVSSPLATSAARDTVRGIDVGAGTNLYPAMAMLPFCDQIVLYEWSFSNLRWLRDQCAGGWPSWDPAWEQGWLHFRARTPYRNIAQPRAELSERVDVVRGSILDSGRPELPYDVGTMFFVAESITGRYQEFNIAIDNFFRMLKPQAPFVLAFMEHSQGYRVGSGFFPAVNLGMEDIRQKLQGNVAELWIQHIGAGENPLRDGYTGMVLATGFTEKKAYR